MQNIYKPAEDSYLLEDCLKEKIPSLIKENRDLKFLEIGCGSGVLLNAALNSGIKKENILGVDINPDAVAHCSKLGFNSLVSDLFEAFKGGVSVRARRRSRQVPLKFDVIVFNPPYLPEDKREPEDSKRATTGGKKGNEVIIKFLEQVKNHLEKEGRIFLITSSLAEGIDFEKFGFKTEEISSRKMFFERIVVWEVRR